MQQFCEFMISNWSEQNCWAAVRHVVLLLLFWKPVRHYFACYTTFAASYLRFKLNSFPDWMNCCIGSMVESVAFHSNGIDSSGIPSGLSPKDTTLIESEPTRTLKTIFLWYLTSWALIRYIPGGTRGKRNCPFFPVDAMPQDCSAPSTITFEFCMPLAVTPSNTKPVIAPDLAQPKNEQSIHRNMTNVINFIIMARPAANGA